MRAEAEVKASLLKEKDGEKSKEEAPVPVGSPGMCMSLVYAKRSDYYLEDGGGGGD